MPRRDPAERHLLDLVRALAAAHDGRRIQWASHADIAARLPSLDLAQLDALIAVAVSRGWVQASGNPAHSLLLTAEGRLQLH